MTAKISDIPAVERLFNLSAFLLGERVPVPLRIIITMVEGYSPLKDFESNRKMFIRDRKELQAMGIEIQLEKIDDPVTGVETDGYKIDKDNFYLPKIKFTAEEIGALNESALLFSQGKKGVGAGDGSLEWARAKLTGPAEGDRGESSALAMLGEDSGVPDEEIMETVRTAVASRRRLTIAYTPVGGASAERDIDPYGLFLRRGLWYVVAHCHLRKSLRMFRLDRVEKVSATGAGESPDFEIPPDFSLDAHIRNRAPWDFGEGEPTKITVKFDPEIFWQVQNAWGNLSSAEFNEGAGEVTFISMNDRALILWALEYGDKAEITAPPEARAAAAGILKGILANAGRNG